MNDTEGEQHRAGFISLVGRPNVGKSTLLNQVVGTTLAAVANKPQTTRNRIVGILNRPNAQLVSIPHPSPVFVNRAPGNRDRILSVLKQVASTVAAGDIGKAHDS